MIEIRNLRAGYSGKTILHELSAVIPDSGLTVIIGPNGCGKTTLLKTLCGILPAESGEILLNGQNIRTLQPKLLARQIAYLSQSRQIPDITVKRMVLHGRFPYLSYPRHYRPEDLRIAEKAMVQMGISDLADTPLATLSGGQRQKVYIAMALAQDTPTVLLDEPTTFLDISQQLQTMAHARALSDSGKTVVMILHDLSLALQNADSILLMDRGQVIMQGTPEEVYASGSLETVFGVKIGRTRTPQGWQYYFSAK